MTLPALVNAPTGKPATPGLYDAYLAALAQRGAGNSSFRSAARSFMARWPDPAEWAAQPLQVRLSAGAGLRPFLNFLMLGGFLRPGHDYLLERKLSSVLREAAHHQVGGDLTRFLAAAGELGFTPHQSAALASQVVMRLLIQTGRPLIELTESDLAEFDTAIGHREQVHGRSLKHYRVALHATRTVLYHLGAPVTAAVKHTAHLRWSWERHFTDIPTDVGRSPVAYLECAAGTRTRSTVLGIAGRLAHFARFVTAADPALTSLAQLDRQRHIEPYLAAVAAARNPHTAAALSASERRSRILTVGRMIDDIIEWGWSEAPTRRLIFPKDIPRLPRALPRYLPADQDRALAAALQASPNRLRADALLLLRATGMRIGELIDLELDCVHEVPGAGAWVKVPLGKLATERMVPIDAETLDLLDRITEHRSPGMPLRHPRTGKPVDFLLTHQGRRVSRDTLRAELTRAALEAGLKSATPHQLRHTYATALVNSGVSLQALMALLGHVSAEMSLRYGRLFDATVRADYEKALTLAKSRLGPVLPQRKQLPIADVSGGTGSWQDTPLIKTRLSGGYCLRTAAQGTCSYANICEHCPSLRTDNTFLPILAAQRLDAQALAADAQARGWTSEATRHQALIAQLDQLISQAETA
ncbi:site-specific integrase [Nakamurella sp. PAMC28650]|uniref:tyrosine-type recombinase/integrase n=1 Tax=Nakamurella sp. PAMC28650 TaxID=2762325 RepID=UPI00164E252A|nr:site-specific integrase [Nakamurella sp. PAMC28650]QNK80520.1 site-specific integrase [Nakamurella sp. PAMC28650]